MFNAGKQAVLALVVAMALAGCTAMTGKTAGGNIDDANITAAVKAKLAGDKASTLTSIDVDTVNGTVYLNGTVPDAAARQRAASLTRQVDGVIAVENNLQSRSAPAGDAPERDFDRTNDY